MKKVFLVLTFVMSFLMCSSSIISANAVNNYSSNIQLRFTDWVEYVQIDGQWYKITHLDDGGQIIQSVMGPGE